jgi:hypothetical protein
MTSSFTCATTLSIISDAQSVAVMPSMARQQAMTKSGDMTANNLMLYPVMERVG